MRGWSRTGLFFPIDLGADPRVGGMLATNTGGSRFLRYGDVRRNTLGVKVVLADEQGTVLDLMSGLRKNNTGVDWKQLFIGTSGAFGIVTECVLNLEPLPRQVATAYLVPRKRRRCHAVAACDGGASRLPISRRLKACLRMPSALLFRMFRR